jgi:hypothetical protein
MKHRAPAELDMQSPAAGTPAGLTPGLDQVSQPPLAMPMPGARSREEAEARYVAARDAWTLAMHAANSGRPADLASLAIAQEAYEAAAAEREQWLTGRVAIPIEPAAARRKLEIAVGQELAWRKIHEHPRAGGLIGRLRRRLRGE